MWSYKYYTILTNDVYVFVLKVSTTTKKQLSLAFMSFAFSPCHELKRTIELLHKQGKVFITIKFFEVQESSCLAIFGLLNSLSIWHQIITCYTSFLSFSLSVRRAWVRVRPEKANPFFWHVEEDGLLIQGFKSLSSLLVLGFVWVSPS